MPNLLLMALFKFMVFQMPSDYDAITAYNELQLGLDTASRKTQISMYSDPTHFVYEILQNADDYGATEIFFRLSKSELVIEHNGEPFKEENVKAITYFGKSTSADDLVKTGRFGVGFKSVFAFTATPIVLSGDEHFQIFGLYRIRDYLFPDGLHHSRTRIVLPFNHETEQPDYVDEIISQGDAYLRIENRLIGLNMNTLLFTQNIREIRWEVEGRTGHYLREDKTDEGVRLTTIMGAGERLNEYLVFSRKPIWKEQSHKPVEIAFALNEKGQIEAPEDDYLYVLFATAQETHLQFILNGPYRTNPSRETISEEDSFNKHLVAETSILMKETLLSLKNSDLITTQFLSVLPNAEDKLRDFYEPLRITIVETFCEQPLIPTDDNQYALSTNLFRGSAPIRSIFKKDELVFFIGNESSCWVKGVRPNSRADMFLKMLSIHQWNWDEMLETLSEKFGANKHTKQQIYERVYYSVSNSLNEWDDKDSQWLDARSDSWLRSLYELIANHGKECTPKLVSNIKMIRVIENNKIKYVTPSNAYFPKQGYLHLPQVKKEILDAEGQHASEEIKHALELLGISEIGDTELIEKTLETHYHDPSTIISDADHLQHMKDFVLWWKKGSDIGVFSEHHCFRSSESEQFHQASDCFLDLPFQDTGLQALFNCKSITLEKVKRPLWKKYDDIEEFAAFANAVGVMSSLEVRTHKATEMQKNIFPVIGQHTDTTIDKDYFINSLEEDSQFPGWHSKASKYYLGSLKLNERCIELSRAIWCTLYYSKDKWANAFYRPNQSNKDKEKTSSSFLLNQLLHCTWVPDKDGGFRLPHDSTKESLPLDFPTDNSSFLKLIRFDTRIQITSQENARKITNAVALGVTLEEVEFLKKMKQNPSLWNEYKERVEQGERCEEFPESSSKNPERRKIKLQNKVIEATDKKTKVSARTVNISKTEIDAQSYLRNLYVNSNDVLICQLCHDPMPFRKRDGQYYMEAVEIAGFFPKEMEELYLALCPNCAAKYKYFIKKDGKFQKQLVAELLQTDSALISLSLGEANETLRFVEKHLDDLKAILEKFGKTMISL